MTIRLQSLTVTRLRARSRALAVLTGLLLALFAGGAARAQPFDSWLTITTGYPTHTAFLDIPDAAVFDISGNFTVEAWLSISNTTSGEDCRSIAGKGFTTTWWLGQCNVGGQPTLRSYLKGSGSLRQGGIIPRGVWTHVAVVFNGSHRRHYINGELAAEFAESGPLPTNNQPIQIGSDVSWPRSPAGAMDEVRLWNVARTESQLRANLNKRIVAQAGLVGLWTLDGTGIDISGGAHHGTLMGTGTGYATFPAGPPCSGSTASTLCLQGRFAITIAWRTNPTPGNPTDGPGGVSVAGSNSGLFWFFSADNWEVMVKAINGCGLNDRYWIFSASATNVFYRMTVFDSDGLEQKIYFNYAGPPAPAVTDTSAFATCP